MVAWACMAACRTVSLVFIDDATADSSSRLNSEVNRSILKGILLFLITPCMYLLSMIGISFKMVYAKTLSVLS